jgi:hypothetical protein
MRLKDARALMRSGSTEAAYYLTGLAVECAVKACIAKNTKRHDFPPNQSAIRDIYMHDLVKLVGAAKLQPTLDAERRRNSSFDNKWDIVKGWNIGSRYATGGLDAKALYGAVAGKNGVMEWLRRHW